MNEENEIVTQENVMTTKHEKLASIYDTFILQNSCVDDMLNERLNVFMQQVTDMDTKTYVEVLYMKGVRYEAGDNKNAARYCALRIYAIQESFMKPRKKRPRNLNMTDYEFPEDMNDFVNRYTDFLEETYQNINRRLLMVTIVLFFIAAFALIFILHMNILFAAMEALLLGLLNYILQKRKMPVIFMRNQLHAIEQYVEENVLDFDRPIRFS